MSVIDLIFCCLLMLSICGFAVMILYFYIKVHEIYGVPNIVVDIKNKIYKTICDFCKNSF